MKAVRWDAHGFHRPASNSCEVPKLLRIGSYPVRSLCNSVRDKFEMSHVDTLLVQKKCSTICISEIPSNDALNTLSIIAHHSAEGILLQKRGAYDAFDLLVVKLKQCREH